jgi:hypothetical protein
VTNRQKWAALLISLAYIALTVVLLLVVLKFGIDEGFLSKPVERNEFGQRLDWERPCSVDCNADHRF